MQIKELSWSHFVAETFSFEASLSFSLQPGDVQDITASLGRATDEAPFCLVMNLPSAINHLVSLTWTSVAAYLLFSSPVRP